LPLYERGELQPQPQDDSQASYCRMLTKEDGRIDWSLPAIVIERMTRAYDPWPGAWTTWRGQTLKIGAALVDPDWRGDDPPGAIVDSQRFRVATGSGALEVLEVQPAGKRMMPAREWLRGQRDLRAGESLNT
jgi:methionyl-tRNA formyltransferase